MRQAQQHQLFTVLDWGVANAKLEEVQEATTVVLLLESITHLQSDTAAASPKSWYSVNFLASSDLWHSRLADAAWLSAFVSGLHMLFRCSSSLQEVSEQRAAIDQLLFRTTYYVTAIANSSPNCFNTYVPAKFLPVARPGTTSAAQPYHNLLSVSVVCLWTRDVQHTLLNRWLYLWFHS